METSPRVFISYSHDSTDHQHAILTLATRLRKDGVDARLDQYVQAPPAGWPRWMEEEIAKAEFVLLVCTEVYERRVMRREPPGQGLGVLWESNLIYQHLYEAGTDNSKFIPILTPGGDARNIPAPIRGVQHYAPFTEEGYELLYRRLTFQPAVSVPLLGKRRILEPVTIPNPDATPGNQTAFRCTNSPRAAILNPNENVQLFVFVSESQWDEREVKLRVVPDTAEEGTFLDGLRGSRKELFIAYRNNVAIAIANQVQHVTTSGKDQWQIGFALKTTDFVKSLEFNTPGLTADKAAVQRARRILLNENPAQVDGRHSGDIIEQMMISGGDSNTFKILKSPFPDLFHHLGNQPEIFLESAWILAVLQLKISATVEHVGRLEISLNGNALDVVFSGRRRKLYVNNPPFQIDVSGSCKL